MHRMSDVCMYSFLSVLSQSASLLFPSIACTARLYPSIVATCPIQSSSSSSYDASHIFLSNPFPYHLVYNLVPCLDSTTHPCIGCRMSACIVSCQFFRSLPLYFSPP